MSSIGSILSVARTALLAHQAALEVAGHNIANAETPGYTRQDLLLGTGDPRITPQGNYGTGTRIVTVGRARDMLLDQDVRSQLGPASYSTARRDALMKIEGVFGEPSPNGLAASLDSFWNAWSDLASQPSNAGARAVVKQRAQALIDRFNTYSNELQTLENSARQQAADGVSQVNRISEQIARLNAQIVPSESSGHTANDLRDERDRLIDQLGALVPVTVIDRADGSSQINLGGRPLVDGVVAARLEVTDGLPLEVRMAGESTAVRTMGGKVGAYLEIVNNDVAGIRSELDALATALITDVNALHVTGWSPTAGASGNWDPLLGPTGSDILFFDSTAINSSAARIRLSDAIEADANAIAAGGTLDAQGDNSIALAMAGLRDYSPTATGNSFSNSYQAIISGLAGAGRAAADSATVSETLLGQAKTRRESTSGVSTDEDLMRLMRHQQAYAAAAKVIQTVDEMMAVLVGLKR